ncbi:N-succinylglutamate 5-semialdehyde dehydrogenase [Rosistilla carotiformis]|uniref:N-succinylglutamate 5-semialdehyde dehydrogenase n=1 Tax=Rosistilla carotiformis TaxID=2528017 RepID=A0A518JPZ3_9BACT|nr:succinylglutamate-semialdehyde dehydrogenase [Rosistilla carotiformis]QDV67598.1 N-succinylglutamate 5-semialdehyde dehydrogenase [Rosistilla carotiformis]
MSHTTRPEEPLSDLLIDGTWLAGEGPPLTRQSPADGSIVWNGHQANTDQAHAAIVSATHASLAWAARPAADRVAIVRRFGELLTSRRDAFADCISQQVGKPAWEAATEVATSIAKVDVSITAMLQRSATTRQELAGFEAVGRYRPLGVMLVLGPFNFPLHLPGGQIIPALLAGNTVVFKPSELAPAIGPMLVQTWQAAGLPAGVINLLQGGADVATAAIDHPQTAGVLFTGSRRVGVAIHRQLAGRPEVLLALEMGGNNPLVVADARPVDAAIDLAIQSAFLSSGQRCTCARRLIVIDSPENRKFVERLAAAIPRIRCGLPDADPPPFCGPLVSPAAADKVLATQETLLRKGGIPQVRARRDTACQSLVSPGLIDMTAAAADDEECFGPLLQLQWVDDFDAAILAANATRFGLAAGLVGGSTEDFTRFRREVRAGVINWNRQTTGASGRLAFGGTGESGNHRPAGYFAADFCSDPVASLESDRLVPPASLLPGLEDTQP